MPEGNPNLVGIIDKTGIKNLYDGNGFVHDTFMMGDQINNFQVSSKLFSLNDSPIGEGGLLTTKGIKKTNEFSYINGHLCVGNKSVVFVDELPSMEFFIPTQQGRKIIKETITENQTIQFISVDSTNRTVITQTDNTDILKTFFNK